MSNRQTLQTVNQLVSGTESESEANLAKLKELTNFKVTEALQPTYGTKTENYLYEQVMRLELACSFLNKTLSKKQRKEFQQVKANSLYLLKFLTSEETLNCVF